MIDTHPDVSDRLFAERNLNAFLLQALQREHPEWEQADGECPPCQSYAAKLQTIFNSHAPETSLRNRYRQS